MGRQKWMAWGLEPLRVWVLQARAPGLKSLICLHQL